MLLGRAAPFPGTLFQPSSLANLRGSAVLVNLALGSNPVPQPSQTIAKRRMVDTSTPIYGVGPQAAIPSDLRPLSPQ